MRYRGWTRRRRVGVVGALVAMTVLAGGESRAAAVSVWVASSELTGGGASDHFGTAVALDGDRLVVGAQQDPYSTGAGYVRVFERATSGAWAPVATLVAPDGAAGDRFGASVALDGDRLVVGAPWDDIGGSLGAGSVRVFERATSGVWTMVATLTAPDREWGDSFGYPVALDGDRIAAGAVEDDTAAGRDAGSVRVFERNLLGQWNAAATLTDPDGAEDQLFGLSVALGPDRVVAGSPLADTGAAPDAGSVHLFERNVLGQWSSVAKLTESGNEGGYGLFGFSVALDGDRVVVGAPSLRVGSSYVRDAGSAYVFERSASGVWTDVARLIAPDGVPGDEFGFSLALEGDRVVVGVPSDRTEEGLLDATVRVFERAGSAVWAEVATLNPGPQEHRSSLLGTAVALSGDRAVVGAPWWDGGFEGAVFVFDRTDLPDGDADSVPDGNDNCVGVANADQSDFDGDDVGDACDADDDGDGVVDGEDAFPLNGSESVDTDGDGTGNNADADDDGDGIPDDQDAFPLNGSESVDTDGDGTGNNADADDDGDGLADVDDPAPLDRDADDDGIVDGRDVEHIQAKIKALPDSSLSPPAPGHRESLIAQLDNIEKLVASGDVRGAIRKLRDLRTRTDGCGTTADRSDWILDCTAQRDLRHGIDTLIANLGG